MLTHHSLLPIPSAHSPLPTRDPTLHSPPFIPSPFTFPFPLSTLHSPSD
uniref:Uncharacterized protein n=1 Tax=Populus trichocarpa TaxID=3694 RepID=A0A3N7G8N2_POPTR